MTRKTPTAGPTPVCDTLRSSGNWNPDWEPVAALDPDWTDSEVAVGIECDESAVPGGQAGL